MELKIPTRSVTAYCITLLPLLGVRGKCISLPLIRPSATFSLATGRPGEGAYGSPEITNKKSGARWLRLIQKLD